MTPFAPTSFTRVAVNGSEVVSNSIALALLSEMLIGGGGGVGDDPPQPRLAFARTAAANTPTAAIRLRGDIPASMSILDFVVMPVSNRGIHAPRVAPTTEPLYTLNNAFVSSAIAHQHEATIKPDSHQLEDYQHEFRVIAAALNRTCRWRMRKSNSDCDPASVIVDKS